ncbi:hypothetical protein BASA60_003886 [Batrachochytrium salamandrivorans]|nr:hypothetical protein BASA60_003886 [Batrachochytrium salamandrivorans]
MDSLERAIAHVKIQLGMLSVSREEAEQILQDDVYGYRSSLLLQVSSSTLRPEYTINPQWGVNHLNLLDTGLCPPRRSSSLGTLGQSLASPHAECTASATHSSFVLSTPLAHDVTVPKMTSSTETNLATTNLATTNPGAFRHSQVIHKGWDTRIRNQILIIRQVYSEHRETLVSGLMQEWSTMRSLLLRHAAFLPMADRSLAILEENMEKLISRQILALQYTALLQVLRITGEPIPFGYDLSPEMIYSKDSLNHLAVQSLLPSRGDLLLNYSQVVLLESSFAVSQTFSKLEKKRLAYTTGLRLDDIVKWFEMKRMSTSAGQIYRVQTDMAIDPFTYPASATSILSSSSSSNDDSAVHIEGLHPLGTYIGDKQQSSLSGMDIHSTSNTGATPYHITNKYTDALLQTPQLMQPNGTRIYNSVAGNTSTLSGIHAPIFSRLQHMWTDNSKTKQPYQLQGQPPHSDLVFENDIITWHPSTH